MSYLPYMPYDSMYLRPSRLLDQHFGLTLDPEDFMQPLNVPRLTLHRPAGYTRNWTTSASERDTGSTVACDKERFQANLDVQQFKPEEISVKVSGDNVITVEGKHEEREDEHGHIYRHFVRKYVLPKNCDMNRIESRLSSDGVLTIIAPRAPENESDYRNIPITQTGEVAKGTERKSDGDK